MLSALPSTYVRSTPNRAPRSRASGRRSEEPGRRPLPAREGAPAARLPGASMPEAREGVRPGYQPLEDVSPNLRDHALRAKVVFAISVFLSEIQIKIFPEKMHAGLSR